MQMISYTKKVSDPPLQPVIDTKRTEYYNGTKQTGREKTKSLSYHTDLTFLHNTTLQ